VAKCEQLAEMPKAFPLLGQRPGSGIRRRVHGDYLIFYIFLTDRIDILHILHGARDSESMLFPEDER
jgi:toxin ParE1/3/4